MEAELLADSLADTDSLPETDSDADPEAAAPEPLAEAEPPVDSDVPVPAVPLVEAARADEADDPLPDPLPDSELFADSLAVPEAADPLALCDVDSWVDSWVDSLADSVAEPLAGPSLPGVRTVLPSVASVWRLAAVTS